jgi:ferrous iron transport protein B
VALIGNPNTGKSTLFNALAGMHVRVANYPGVTVEKKVGRIHWGDRAVDLIDLPGTYSLSPRSLDEMVSVDVLLGRRPDVGPIDLVVCIADASNLERHLYLVSQVLDMQLPVVLVLNMWDTARAHGLTLDVERLREKLNIPVVVTEAHRRRGIDDVREAILTAAGQTRPVPPSVFPDTFQSECRQLGDYLSGNGFPATPRYLCERLLLDPGGIVEQSFTMDPPNGLSDYLTASRTRLKEAGWPVPFVEMQSRYRWAHALLGDVVRRARAQTRTRTDQIDRLVTHRVFGLVLLALVMFVVFQAIYRWAVPLMELFETGQGAVASVIARTLPPGPLRSLLIDGVVSGVGGVLVFVPQIALLFLFIAILEDSGYMARAAYMMDRVMARFGLSGKSFLPLMSSFACAVPGIMAARVIDHPRDRLVTILVAPLMSCSARLPVYLLMISAFVPPVTYLGGWLSVQGMVLFAMSSLGVLVAIPIAWLLKRTIVRGSSGAFVIELPEYKRPSVRLVLHRMYDRSRAFVEEAGTLIFATTIVVWAAGYFPGDHSRVSALEAELEQRVAQAGVGDDDPQASALRAEIDAESARLIRTSLLGQAGLLIEPVVRPLGWDWRIGVAVLASFPAREVVIGALGTIYSLGGDVDEESAGLASAIRASTWPDGRPVYNLPVALSIMVFFALCAQCSSTLMIIRRETNSWTWPVFTFTYMTLLAYLAALVVYQVGQGIPFA